MPCLAQVAGAVLACKPSSGGLECDFGTLSDVVTAKRSALDHGMVEDIMVVNVKGKLVPNDANKVVRLQPAHWEDHVPKRPVDMYSDDEEVVEEVELQGTDNDSEDEDYDDQELRH